jgi:hypothetical protein
MALPPRRKTLLLSLAADAPEPVKEAQTPRVSAESLLFGPGGALGFEHPAFDPRESFGPPAIARAGSPLAAPGDFAIPPAPIAGAEQYGPPDWAAEIPAVNGFTPKPYNLNFPVRQQTPVPVYDPRSEQGTRGRAGTAAAILGLLSLFGGAGGGGAESAALNVYGGAMGGAKARDEESYNRALQAWQIDSAAANQTHGDAMTRLQMENSLIGAENDDARAAWQTRIEEARRREEAQEKARQFAETQDFKREVEARKTNEKRMTTALALAKIKAGSISDEDANTLNKVFADLGGQFTPEFWNALSPDLKQKAVLWREKLEADAAKAMGANASREKVAGINAASREKVAGINFSKSVSVATINGAYRVDAAGKRGEKAVKAGADSGLALSTGYYKAAHELSVLSRQQTAYLAKLRGRDPDPAVIARFDKDAARQQAAMERELNNKGLTYVEIPDPLVPGGTTGKIVPIGQAGQPAPQAVVVERPLGGSADASTGFAGFPFRTPAAGGPTLRPGMAASGYRPGVNPRSPVPGRPNAPAKMRSGSTPKNTPPPPPPKNKPKRVIRGSGAASDITVEVYGN